ncbi:hypothetical protein [Infirmifilum sp. SLHALR2]
MPMLIVGKLVDLLTSDGLFAVVELPKELYSRYPLLDEWLYGCPKLMARVYVDGFYNESGKLVREYRRRCTPEVVVAADKDEEYYGYIDLTDFNVKDGIPIGYFAQLILTHIECRELSPSPPGPQIKEKVQRITVYPNELAFATDDVPDAVKSLISARLEALAQLSRNLEVMDALEGAGLGAVASDLAEGLRRFHAEDYEGAVKFFRKAVEGLRGYVESSRVEGMGESRQKLLRDFLSKAFQLISNFGEHSGTSGNLPEAELSRNIALAASKYLATYLARQPSEAKA